MFTNEDMDGMSLPENIFKEGDELESVDFAANKNYEKDEEVQTYYSTRASQDLVQSCQ